MRPTTRKTEPSWAGPRGRVGALSRYRTDDDPDLLDARRDLRAARLAAYIEKTVDEAPPLSSEQRDTLALLLRGAA